jgi:hypothetical protein
VFVGERFREGFEQQAELGDQRRSEVVGHGVDTFGTNGLGPDGVSGTV